MHPARLTRIGAALLLLGAAMLVTLTVKQDRDRWIPLSLDLPLESGQSSSAELDATFDGFYELQFEVDAVLPDDELRRFVTTRSDPSQLNVRWAVSTGGAAVAGGDCTGYTYIDPPPKDRLRTLYRLLLRSPYDLNRQALRTFGLAGAATAARGVGRFLTEQGRTYTLEVTAQANHTELASGAPRMIVRPDRRQWQDNWATVESLGRFGWAATAAGALLLVVSLLWRRLAPAPRA